MKYLSMVLLLSFSLGCGQARVDTSGRDQDGNGGQGKLTSGISLLRSQYSSVKLSCALKLTVDDNLGNIEKATRIVEVELLDEPNTWPSMAGLSAHVDHMKGEFAIDNVKIELFDFQVDGQVVKKTPVIVITGFALGEWTYLDQKASIDPAIEWRLLPEDPNQHERHFRHEFSYAKDNGPAVINHYEARCHINLTP